MDSDVPDVLLYSIVFEVAIPAVELKGIVTDLQNKVQMCMKEISMMLRTVDSLLNAINICVKLRVAYL